jgi:hypothetical protein
MRAATVPTLQETDAAARERSTVILDDEIDHSNISAFTVNMRRELLEAADEIERRRKAGGR